MPPTLALIVWLVLLLGLLWFDPAKVPGTSAALWIPVIWMFIAGSRLPSQWLGWSANGVAAQALEEGNPFDRTIFLVLIVLALVVLTNRSFNWGGFFSRNLCLTAFLLFALVSFLWSDFPLIALKRWFRDLGNYFVILVALTDPHPLEAVRTVLRRLGFLLIPLSIVLIKYFPELAKHYGAWSGAAEYVGAATSKNMLGNACLVIGLFFFWDLVSRWSERHEKQGRWVIRLDVFFVAMTLWLLHLSHSATSTVCLCIGCFVVLVIHSAWGSRHLTLIKVLVPTSFCLYLILAFGLNLNGVMVSKLGRDPTLTDRTLIWHAVLSQHTNPIVGTGYESFWLGSRLQGVWQYLPGINETHNGYLDIYVNLGVIGLILLIAVLFATYRSICQKLNTSFAFGSLGVAIWCVILFYNVTEAAFKGGMLWLAMLLGGLSLPSTEKQPARRAINVKQNRVDTQLREPRMLMAARGRSRGVGSILETKDRKA